MTLLRSTPTHLRRSAVFTPILLFLFIINAFTLVIAQDQPFSIVFALPYGLNPDERLEADYYRLGAQIAEVAEENGVPLAVVYLPTRSGSVTALDISASRENGIAGFYGVFTSEGFEVTTRLYLPSSRYNGLRTLFRTEGIFPEMTFTITNRNQFETLVKAATAQIVGILGEADTALDLYDELIADVEGDEPDTNVAALLVGYGDLLVVTELTQRVIDAAKSDGFEAASDAYVRAFSLAGAGESLEITASLRLEFLTVVSEEDPLSLVANVALPEFVAVDDDAESPSDLLASMASFASAAARNSRNPDAVLDMVGMIESHLEDLPDDADPKTYTRLHFELGHLYSFLAIELGDALYFQPAIRAYEVAGQAASGVDDALYFDILVWTGYVYQNFAEYEDTLFNLFNARSAFEDALNLPANDHLGMQMYAYINLGRVYRGIAAFVDAEGYTERSIEAFDAAIEAAHQFDPDSPDVATLHVERAQSLASRAFLSSDVAIPSLKEAMSEIDVALTQIDIEHDAQDYTNALITLARIRMQYANLDAGDAENYALLIQQIEQGLSRLGDSIDSQSRAILLYHLGYGYLRHAGLVGENFETYRTGIGFLEEALALIDPEPVTFDYGSILYELYSAYLNQGRVAEGCETLQAFVQYLRDIDEVQDASYDDFIEQYEEYYRDTCERFM